jgi:hypothetical protein
MVYGPTSHNRLFTLHRYAPRGSVRLGRSATLHSYGPLYPHFASQGLATHDIFKTLLYHM